MPSPHRKKSKPTLPVFSRLISSSSRPRCGTSGIPLPAETLHRRGLAARLHVQIHRKRPRRPRRRPQGLRRFDPWRRLQRRHPGPNPTTRSRPTSKLFSAGPASTDDFHQRSADGRQHRRRPRSQNQRSHRPHRFPQPRLISGENPGMPVNRRHTRVFYLRQHGSRVFALGKTAANGLYLRVAYCLSDQEA